MINRWFQAVCLFLALSNTLGRPKENAHPVYRSLDAEKDGSIALGIMSEGKIDKTEKSLEDIANVARSSYEGPTSTVAQAPEPHKVMTNMADKDVRTPPKLKDILKDKDTKNESTTVTTPAPTIATSPVAVDKIEANGKFQVAGTPFPGSFEGKSAATKKEEVIKGVAVPVIMDEEVETPPKKLQKLPSVVKPKEEKKKVISTVKPLKDSPTTTPSSGLSTWILLSDNREATTASSANKKKTSTTTKKPVKLQHASTTLKVTTNKPTKKPTPAEKKDEPQSALETMVKQKAGGLVTAQKKKDQNEKKVVTVPPAIVIESTEASLTELAVTESTQETTTKKKKTSSKKRKKNKTRTKKPAEKSGADQIINDLVKQPIQPVGAQFYNFLSREIMPTVGLGLVGVLVTAGLAGLLGYNPFYGANIPVRRTYESQHGYYPNSNNYYTYQSDYGDSNSGKNEEVLFREVLSGMPEDSRYGMPPAEVSYPETQLHNSQEQAYQASKNKDKKPEYTSSSYSEPFDPPLKSEAPYSDQYETRYDSYTNQEHVGSKYPVYSGADSYVYPEKNTEKYKASAKYSEDDTIEKQPEALYRVSSDYSAGGAEEGPSASATDSDQSWHRIGSPMDYPSQASHIEPGPRRLDLDKMTDKLTQAAPHKRSKRRAEGLLARLVRRSNEVGNINLEDEKQNEIDFEDGGGNVEVAINTEKTETSSVHTSTESELSSATPLPSTEQPSLLDSFPNASPTTTTEVPPSLMDVLKRLAQFKLRLGINFLKATTEAFGKYLEGVSQRVEDSMANETYPAIRYSWFGRDEGGSDTKIREKRYQREIKDVLSGTVVGDSRYAAFSVSDTSSHTSSDDQVMES